eukprot:TRINITY_DN7914_c0_g1_i1.p1 TRINITY_DN7914_c0_g1~~TRINITY_DN7914_c0_g1_i1.p1  ORF type:complete len:447 (+),score=106.14 TRINITY_DN7914_c0_g1_i1:81-1343(+)
MSGGYGASTSPTDEHPVTTSRSKARWPSPARQAAVGPVPTEMDVVLCDFKAKQFSATKKATPKPCKKEVLCKVLACGVCGSDLHLYDHGDQELGLTTCCLGHEYVGEIVELGSEVDSNKLKVGDRVAAMPVRAQNEEMKANNIRPPLIGGVDEVQGGMAKYLVLTAELCNVIPEGVPSTLAALSEPLGIAVHSVNAGKHSPDSNSIPIVFGCGPVGLLTIVVLKERGFSPIIAVQRSEFRRQLAGKVGADILVDPSTQDIRVVWRDAMAKKCNVSTEEVERWELGNFSDMTFNLIWEDVSNGKYIPPMCFENIGVPGSVEMIAKSMPRHTQIVLCGMCLECDPMRHVNLLGKETEIKYVFGYVREQFTAAVDIIASGKHNHRLEEIVTGVVQIDGDASKVQETFQDIRKNKKHAKVLLMP